jgi:hypothetical protein
MKIKRFFSKIAERMHLALARFMGAAGMVLYANLMSQRTYDAALLLKAAGLVAATADGTLILDVGGGAPNPIIGFLEADMIIDVTALEVDTNDESYIIILEGSPDPTFGTAANIAVLSRTVIGSTGAAAQAPQGTSVVDAVGRYTVPVRNERNGVTYRYLRIRTVVAGTIATGINYSCWLSKDE